MDFLASLLPQGEIQAGTAVPPDYVEPSKYDWRDPNQSAIAEEEFFNAHDAWMESPPITYPPIHTYPEIQQPASSPPQGPINNTAGDVQSNNIIPPTVWVPRDIQETMDAQWILGHQADYTPQAVWNALRTLGKAAGERPPEVMPIPPYVSFQNPGLIAQQHPAPSFQGQLAGTGNQIHALMTPADREEAQRDALERAIANPTVQRWVKFLMGN